MKFVVDTNILFSFFRKDSLIKKILESPSCTFHSPFLALKEIEKYSPLIISKTGLSKKDFLSEFKNLKSSVKFHKEKNYKNYVKISEEISPDKDDAEFFALCLVLNLPLWSNDKILKNQGKVVVCNTEEIINSYFG
ncbi:MAG: hypothetical protein KKC19_01990 [Nanoarchaeota archaeon]|nr:hypothetical protein [Nanoarchaeota archaeon]